MHLRDFFSSAPIRAVLIGLVAVSLAAACAPSSKRRTTGTVIDDQTIEVKAINAIYDTPEFDEGDHVKIEVHNGTVLLVGETKSQANKDLATSIVSNMRGVNHVVNDLEVGRAASLGSRLDNSYISAKANSILTAKNPVDGVDMTRIKVITSKRTVYLMGTVTHQEAAEVTEVVRNIGGVQKVVKVFDYVD
jgi:osmotically-inducible protein OsmY